MDGLKIGGLGSIKTVEPIPKREEESQKGEISKAFNYDPFEIQLSAKVEEESLIKAVDDVNQKLLMDDKRLEYSYHERTKSYVVKLVDSKTGDTIKEIPPKKILDMVADMWDRFGLFVDEKI